MEHPYFEGIDWQKVENQEYERKSTSILNS